MDKITQLEYCSYLKSTSDFEFYKLESGKWIKYENLNLGYF